MNFVIFDIDEAVLYNSLWEKILGVRFPGVNVIVLFLTYVMLDNVFPLVDLWFCSDAEQGLGGNV